MKSIGGRIGAASLAYRLPIAALSAVLAACGGGNGEPVPAATVILLSSPISRMVAVGSSVAIEATIKPNFVPIGSLSITAIDATGAIDAAVGFTANADGSYRLSLSSSALVAAGRYSGNLTLNLCADAACNTHQPVPSVVVPFEISVLTPGGAWPGDHLTALSAWNGIADWSMYQGNAGNTGYVPVQLDPDKFSTRWQIAALPAGGAGWGLPGNLVATAEDKLYVAGGNLLYARKESDSDLVWQYDFSGLTYPSTNPPAVANGAVYIVAGQQSSTFLFAFDSGDGSLRFKAPMNSQWEHHLPPTIGADGLYTEGNFGSLFMFDTSGQALFLNTLGQVSSSMWTPAVDAQGVYVYTDGQLRSLDPKTGNLRQSISDPSFQNFVYEIGGSPVLGNDSVFVANYNNATPLGGVAPGNTLIRFRPSTGSIAWQFAGAYPSTPAYAAGVLYVANERPVRLEARAEADGALLWSWVPPLAGDTEFVSEVLLTRNLVFVSTGLAVYAVDVTTHKAVWSYPQPGRLALSRNGILYVHGQQFLTAINAK